MPRSRHDIVECKHETAKHWTRQEAEAADRARRAAADRIIRAKYAPKRRSWRALIARFVRGENAQRHVES